MTLDNRYRWRANRLALNTASQLKRDSSGPTILTTRNASLKALILDGIPILHELSLELALVDLSNALSLSEWPSHNNMTHLYHIFALTQILWTFVS